MCLKMRRRETYLFDAVDIRVGSTLKIARTQMAKFPYLYVRIYVTSILFVKRELIFKALLIARQ